MVRCEQGSVPGSRARAVRAFRPRRRGPLEKNQSPHRRGRPPLRRIRLPDLPGHSVLAGQEPVQDPYRNPFLARQGGTAGAHDAGLLSPPGVRGERRPFWRLASGAADPQENPGSNRRRARCVEDRPSIEDPTRGRVPETAPARLRSEPSANPGPAPKGLHRIASLPRRRGREPRFPREFRERMRVDGPFEPIPRGVDGTAVVTSTWTRKTSQGGGTVDRFILLAYAKSSRSDWLNERFTIHTARNDGTFFRETDPFVFTSVAPMVEEYVLSTRRMEPFGITTSYAYRSGGSIWYVHVDLVGRPPIRITRSATFSRGNERPRNSMDSPSRMEWPLMIRG